MTARGASSSVQTEWAAQANRPIHLVQAQFDVADGGTVYCTDCHRSVSWDGHTYTALGHLLAFSGLEEAVETKVTSARLTLSGVDQTWIALALMVDYVDRPLAIYKAMLDTAEALVSDPVLIFSGRMDQPSIEEDPAAGSSVVTVEATSHFVDFERRTGRRTVPAEQALYFPADRAFDQVAAIAGQQVQILWGRPRP